MSARDTAAPAPRRRHDAQASRRALLDAARALFEERGYERATVRDIGERAEVDPALIARYFGGKEGLYLAALAESDRPPLEGDPATIVATLLEQWDERGHSPISRALVSPALSDDLRTQVRDILRDRLLTPLTAELQARDAAEPELRAEILVALVTGVALTRASGVLETLAATDRAVLLRALDPLLDALAR
jgi:AcrR family transcriptional regulator